MNDAATKTNPAQASSAPRPPETKSPIKFYDVTNNTKSPRVIYDPTTHRPIRIMPDEVKTGVPIDDVTVNIIRGAKDDLELTLVK